MDEVTTLLVPTEEQEQATLADWLNLHGLLWLHIPNEGLHHVAYRRKQARLGLRAGAPDILIFDPPPAHPSSPGVAIELKRVKGGRVRPQQLAWLEELRDRGWFARVCYGAGEAIEWLETLGYGRRR